MQKLLQKLFGKKTAPPNPVDDFRREEKAAMALPDFAESVQTLNALYQKMMSSPGNLSLNYLEGKKDACFYINLYLEESDGYSMNDMEPFRRSMEHSKNYSHEEFHRAKLEILEWAYERMLVIQPPK